MRFLLYSFLLAAPTLSWCERQNPTYCDSETPCLSGRCNLATNLCIDRGDAGACMAKACGTSTPVCDEVDETCRACLPGEDRLCAARSAATPRCLGPTCVECLPPTDGSSLEAPECARDLGAAGKSLQVCDRDRHACRPCQLHSECASQVCAKDPDTIDLKLPQGSCVPQDQVLVVDPSQCTSNGPVFCRPAEALAKMNRSHRFLLIRQSALDTDFSDLQVGSLATEGVDVYVIGPLADVPPNRWTRTPPTQLGAKSHKGLVVLPRNRVTVEGLLIRGGSTGIQCYGTGSNNTTQIRVRRSMIAGNQLAADVQLDCTLTLDQAWIGRWPGRCGFGALPGNEMSLNLSSSSFDIVNSVISENGVVGLDSFGAVKVTGGLGSRAEPSTIVNSTLYGQPTFKTAPDESGTTRKYMSLYCGNPIASGLVVLNSLFFQNRSLLVPDGRQITPACGKSQFNLGSDDPSLTGVMTTAPGWKDETNRDFHLAPTGQPTAEQLALQTGGAKSVQVTIQGKQYTVSAPATDMDGAARSGATVYIGAFEGPGAALDCP